MKVNRMLLLAVCLFLPTDFVFAECDKRVRLPEWVNCKVQEVVQARINQRGNTQQTEAPSVAGSSTSLVDQSSATDLLGTALNLAGLSSNSDETKKSSFSFTASAYSLYAAALKQDPLDPSFYSRNRDWRRVSFTLGAEYPDENGASSDERAIVAGVKLLLVDHRDASHQRNKDHIRNVANSMIPAGPAMQRIQREIEDYLYKRFAQVFGLPGQATFDSLTAFNANAIGDEQKVENTLNLLNDDDSSEINRIIDKHVSSVVAFQSAAIDAVEAIRRGPQFSVSYNAKQRKENANDEHRVQAIFDYGVMNRVNLNINASFDYVNCHGCVRDMRGGRIAADWQVQLTPESALKGRAPWTLDFAGEGKWMTEVTPTYQAQLKFKIPVIEGVDFPISLTWASRTELINEADVKGRFGFTFDFAKLIKAFQQ